MRKGLALWMICFSLIAARVVGLHLHVCDGLGTGTHAGSHYADNGFLFGEHHAEDDADDQEEDPGLGLVPSFVQLDLGDLVAPIPATPVLVSAVEQLLSVLAPRGPPSALPSRRPHFTPPLRGPPIDSLA